MENPKPQPKDDVLTQPYKGPSQLAAGLGEGAVQTKFLTLAGIGIGGLGAFFFHEPAAKVISRFNKTLHGWAESPNRFVQPAGQIGKWLLGIGKHTVDWLRKFESIEKGLGKLERKQMETAIEGAIITSTGLGLIELSSDQFSMIRSRSAGTSLFTRYSRIRVPRTILTSAARSDASRIFLSHPSSHAGSGLESNFEAISGKMSCSQLMRRARRSLATTAAGIEIKGGSVFAMTTSPLRASVKRRVMALR